MKLENYIYLENKAVVFAYIPKVACTNWRAVFRHMSGFEDYLNPHLTHDRDNGGLVYLSDMPNRDEILADTQVRKYTMVRNPFSRTLSAYLNKIHPFTVNEEAMKSFQYFHNVFQDLEAYSHDSLGKDVDFASFLKWIEDGSSEYTQDQHWALQSGVVGNDLELFDFVGRFEKISEDAPTILNLIGCDIGFPTQSDVSFRPTNANNRMKSFYSDESIELVKSIYRPDFLALGYSEQNFSI